MVIRGVYTKAEENMLAEWRGRMDKQIGWLGETPTEQVVYPVTHRVASKEAIMNLAYIADYWNPIWRDESYARNTRWGNIIASPAFLTVIAFGSQDYFLKIPPEVGAKKVKVCHCYDYIKPIYVNDSFRVWCGHAEIKDITRPGESTNREFKYDWPIIYMNQKDEVVGILRRSDITKISPPVTQTAKQDFRFTEDYIYSKEDIEAIDRACEAEEIRGAEIRYWEDVNTGDELKPVVVGPVAPWDCIAALMGGGYTPLPMREVRKQTPERVILNPMTYVPHKSIEKHVLEKTAKLDKQFGYSTVMARHLVEATLARIVTNWMGDDGFLRRMEWIKLVSIPIGDTMFARGKVIRKYIDENDDYLVDVSVWLESNRGFVGYIATITVSLLSKEKIFKRGEPPILVNAPVRRKEIQTGLNTQEGIEMSDIKAGDRVKIKDRPDWPMPSGYHLGNLEGKVDEIIDENEGQLEKFVLVMPEKDTAGIDTSVPLGFRMDAVEKI